MSCLFLYLKQILQFYPEYCLPFIPVQIVIWIVMLNVVSMWPRNITLFVFCLEAKRGLDCGLVFVTCLTFRRLFLVLWYFVGFQEGLPSWRGTSMSGSLSWASMPILAHTPVGATLAPPSTRSRLTHRLLLTGKWTSSNLTAATQAQRNKRKVRVHVGNILWSPGWQNVTKRCIGLELVFT